MPLLDTSGGSRSTVCLLPSRQGVYTICIGIAFDPVKRALNLAKDGVHFVLISEFGWESALIRAFPEIRRRLRGPQKEAPKELISIRLDRDVVTALRESGPGWQSRVAHILRKAVLG